MCSTPTDALQERPARPLSPPIRFRVEPRGAIHDDALAAVGTLRRPMASTRRRTRWGVVLCAGLFGLMLAACPSARTTPRYEGAGSKVPTRGGTFRFHSSGHIRTLDPHIAYDELSIAVIRHLFEGLLDYDDEGRMIPALAREVPVWEEGGRRLVLHLRQDARFHNGRAVTAHDVRWSLEHLLHPSTNSPGATFFSQLRGLQAYRAGRRQHLEGVQVLDRHAVAFALDAPDQTFLNALAMTFAMPVAREAYAGARAHPATRPIGTGPFRLAMWERGVRMVVERAPTSWRKQRTYLDRLVFYENVGDEVAAMRFRNGELEYLSAMAIPDYLLFRNHRAWRASQHEAPQPSTWGITLNCEMKPFDNRHVRRAVAYAIDRHRWNRSRNGRLRPTGQPLPPSIGGYLPPEHAAVQRYDLDAARRELRLGGYAKGLPEPVTLWLGGSPKAQYYGELAQADLAKIGIQVELKQVAFPVFIAETGQPGRAQMSMGGWGQDFPDAVSFFEPLFHSKSIHARDSENRSFYRNPKLDALLDQARQEVNPERRLVMYRRASAMVSKDAPWAFVWNDLDFEVWQPYVRNYVTNPVWSMDFRSVWLDLPLRPVGGQ